MTASAASRVYFRTCNLCEAMCGLRIELEAERITSIRGDEEGVEAGLRSTSR